jgi:hypothetical protein
MGDQDLIIPGDPRRLEPGKPVKEQGPSQNNFDHAAYNAQVRAEFKDEVVAAAKSDKAKFQQLIGSDPTIRNARVTESMINRAADPTFKTSFDHQDSHSTLIEAEAIAVAKEAYLSYDKEVKTQGFSNINAMEKAQKFLSDRDIKVTRKDLEMIATEGEHAAHGKEYKPGVKHAQSR